MKFWITDGIIHHELTKDMDYLHSPSQEYQVYSDAGTSIEIADNSESIQIPDGVIAIGKKAFQTSFSKKEMRWKNLKKVILPNSVQIIDDHAFEGCTALEDIVLPEGLEKLGAFAFFATAIRNIKFPDNLKEIGDFCFSSSQLEKIKLPTSPTKIERHAFNGCANIKEFIIPEYIDHSLDFSGCTSLEKVENLKWDDTTSFCECTSLKEVVIPDGAKSITTHAFKNCTSLRELTIPSSVKKVHSPFIGCTGLKKLTLKSAFKDLETAFPDSKHISEVYTTESIASKAHFVFPDATILNLKGKVLFSSGKTEEGRSDDKIGKALSSTDVNGIIEKTIKIPKLLQWAEKKDINISALKKVKLQGNGKAASPNAVLFFLYEYMKQVEKMPTYHKDSYKTSFCPVVLSPVAETIAQTLDKASLLAVLSEKVAPSVYGEIDMVGFEYDIIWGKVPKGIRKSWEVETYKDFLELIDESDYTKFQNFDRLAPYCRFVDEDTIAEIIRFAGHMIKSKGMDGRKLSIVIRSALLLSDTHAAAVYMDKCGLLDAYALIRGTTADELRKNLQSNPGFNAEGSLSFDL